MGEQMNFPDTLDEFIKQYSFIDRKEIYTNGSELIQTFRVKQWEEHRQREYQELKKKLDELQTLYNNMFKCHCNRVQVETLLSQQKEFIEWLESNLEALEMCDRELILTNNKKEIKAYKEGLSKYKEIIGVRNE